MHFPVFLRQIVFSKDGCNKISSFTWSLYNMILTLLPLRDRVCSLPLNLGRFVTSVDLTLCDSRGWVIIPPASLGTLVSGGLGHSLCKKREASQPGHRVRTQVSVLAHSLRWVPNWQHQPPAMWLKIPPSDSCPQLSSHLQLLSLTCWGPRYHGAEKSCSTVSFLNSRLTESVNRIKWL